MKKILFAFAAMAMIFATSCKKENVNEPMQESETTEMRAPLPGEFVATMDKGAMPQYAPSIEEGMGTMAHFDEKNVLWDANDKIIVNGKEYSCSITDGNIAYFSNTDTVYCPYHAFHGAVANTSRSAAGTLSATQTYDPDHDASHIPMYAYSESGNDNPPLEFKNICGALQITVPLSTANKIVVTADEDINGTFTIVETGGKPKAVINNTNSTPANKSITLQRNSGTFQNGDIVYIAVPHGSYHLEIKFMNNDNVEWTTGQSSNAYAVEVNKIHKVNMLGAFGGLLPGKFSVSATKKVRFTTGNLWYDGTNARLEQKQTDFPDTWNTTHVGHFMWNTTAAGAAGTSISGDYIFCAQGKGLRVYAPTGNDKYNDDLYLMSKEEWIYVFANKTMKKYVTVGNVLCLVIAPDGFTGNIANSYTSADDVTKIGFVCLPYAGYRNPSGNTICVTNSNFSGEGNPDGKMVRYWTSTNNGSSAWRILFDDDYYGVYNMSKEWGCSIRLVQDVPSPQ